MCDYTIEGVVPHSQIVRLPIFSPPRFRLILLPMILIVEDNAQVRRMIRALVENFDSDVRECQDGADAFAAYQEHRPDWVLMDLAMPRGNGLDATREIIAAFPDARIAIVTNYDDPNMRRAAREAGAAEYVVKESLFDLRRVLASHAKTKGKQSGG